jgi:hypothetical protein
LIRQQTRILAGSDEPIIPLVNARLMRRLLPNADLLIYDDGHLGLLTRARVSERGHRLSSAALASAQSARAGWVLCAVVGGSLPELWSPRWRWPRFTVG